MKISISSFVLALMLSIGTIFISCQSAFQKEEAATAEMIAADLSKTSSPTDIKAMDYKIINADEWEIFRSEADAKIRSNEMLLAELSVQLSKPGTTLDTLFAEKIKTLNSQNQAFIYRLNAYAKNRSDWETFKRDFNSDMEELEKVLKELASINKK